jgi:L-aspartate oxidase
MITTRYIADITPDMPVYSTDFLVIGSGIAGLFSALKAVDLGDVVVLTKKSIQDSNTGLAQGGIAAAIHEEDSPFLHLEDTLEAGAGLCDPTAVSVLVNDGPTRVQELMEIGARFDTRDGTVSLTREAAHSKARILHAADATGEAIRAALVARCQAQAIPIYENQFLIDLLTADEDCQGALVYDAVRQQKVVYLARAVILGTGGAGQLYRYTTNPEVATADGLGAAFRAGCLLTDMEFIQFHPTVLAHPARQRFLISEAVRGEGGILLDSQGERFMFSYDARGELAPRDIVARAIWNEMGKSERDCVYLDMRGITNVEQRFPNICRNCREWGIDPVQDLVPVSPAAHYMMGGIKSDVDGKTGILGLYSCGECACTGVHGANRLASNSLLEGIVFGDRIVRSAEEILWKRSVNFDRVVASFDSGWILEPYSGSDYVLPEEACRALKETMWKNVGIIRDHEGLKNAINTIDKLYARLTVGDQQLLYYEAVNMLTAGRIIAQSALWRRESRGAHFRRDYPRSDDLFWVKHLSFRTW